MKPTKSHLKEISDWLKVIKKAIKMYPLWIKITVAILFSGIILCICSCEHYEYQHDNKFEKWVERLIKDDTQIDIDLTPSSPEKHDTK